ncbi:MAG TPA: hypothetical protein VF727_01790 [Allosphingosinicella sp.]|jgi:hypothetical protein
MRSTAAASAAFALTLALAACGQSTPAENSADALENAAEQSTPEAAAVLENAAESIEENGGSPADVQNAMQAAGNAQAVGAGGTQAAPAAKGAKPHAPGDPVPPPKVDAGGGEHAAHNSQ